MSLFIRAPDLRFLKPLYSKARFFVFEPARKIRDTNENTAMNRNELRKMVDNRLPKIFGIGLPRSGTSSLNSALLTLGYLSLHYPVYYSIEQLNGSFNFEGEWDALTNFGENFYPQLDQEFPNSKFILTIRDKEKWLTSCRWKYQEGSNNLGNAIRIGVFGCFKFQEATFSHIYDQHTRNVLDYFKDRPDDLLVVNWESGDGWKELCDFLDKPVPPIDFPNKNSKKDITTSNIPINYGKVQNILTSSIKYQNLSFVYAEILNRAFLGNQVAKVFVRVARLFKKSF